MLTDTTFWTYLKSNKNIFSIYSALYLAVNLLNKFILNPLWTTTKHARNIHDLSNICPLWIEREHQRLSLGNVTITLPMLPQCIYAKYVKYKPVPFEICILCKPAMLIRNMLNKTSLHFEWWINVFKMYLDGLLRRHHKYIADIFELWPECVSYVSKLNCNHYHYHLLPLLPLPSETSNNNQNWNCIITTTYYNMKNHKPWPSNNQLPLLTNITTTNTIMHHFIW